jgi:hypothetical protein
MQNHVVVIQKRCSVNVWLGIVEMTQGIGWQDTVYHELMWFPSTAAGGCPTTGHGTAPSLSIMVSEWQMYE